MTDSYSGSEAEVSWKDLAQYGPAFAAIFAFSYVVGYFYAFDIAWFPFFSFTDHLVFALRALPIGIGAFIVMLLFLSSPTRNHRFDWLIQKTLVSKMRIYWVVFLLALALLLLLASHFGLGISLAAIALGTIFFNFVAKPEPVVRVLYLGANLTAICMLIGFTTGLLWRFPILPFSSKLANSVYIIRNDKTSDNIGDKINVKTLPPAGKILFSGSSGVLLYDYYCKRVRLIRLDEIKEIFECENFECTNERPRTNWDQDCSWRPGAANRGSPAAVGK